MLTPATLLVAGIEALDGVPDVFVAFENDAGRVRRGTVGRDRRGGGGDREGVGSGGGVMTRVLLADDHPLVRQGLRAVFGTVEDIEVVGEVSDGRETVRRAVELAPDVVLMDLQMPGLHGIEATRRSWPAAPRPRCWC